MRSAQSEGKRSIVIRLCKLPAMTPNNYATDVEITLIDSQNTDSIFTCSWRTDRQTFPARFIRQQLNFTRNA